MPSKSKEQEKFFTIAAKDEEFAKKHGLTPQQAKEWHEADKQKKLKDLKPVMESYPSR